jgi:hypothetical protein
MPGIAFRWIACGLLAGLMVFAALEYQETKRSMRELIRQLELSRAETNNGLAAIRSRVEVTNDRLGDLAQQLRQSPR